jgi:hypothetical protein
MKICGVYHEAMNTTLTPLFCKNKDDNPACMHPEETGLFYALILAESLLEKLGQLPTNEINAQKIFEYSRMID